MESARRVSVTLVTALAPAIWGSTYLVTTEWLPPDRPLLATTVRTLPAGLILLAFSRTLPTRPWLWRVLALGTLNIAAFNFLMFVAAYRLPGSIAATLMGVQPMAVLVLAALLMRDRIRPAHVAACVLGAGGVAMLVIKGSSTADPAGVAAALGAALCLAAGITLTKYWGRPDGAGLLAVTGWQLTAGGLVSLPFMLSIEGLPATLNGKNVIGFTYLIVLGAVISYAVWFRGIEKLPALAVSVLALISPVSATILGYVVLDQALSILQMAGIVVIIGSAMLAQPQRATRNRPLPHDAPAEAVIPVKKQREGRPNSMPKTVTPQTIAVIGTGKIGQAIGRLWLESGHRIVFGSRSPELRAPALAELGDRVKVITQADAVDAADTILLAVPGEAVEATVSELRAGLAGKVVIDATNRLNYVEGRWVSALDPGVTEGRWMARRLPESRVVRAFSHVPDELLWTRGSQQALYWAIAIAGDDTQAKRAVADLVRDSGWTPVDLGGLDDSAALDPGGAVFHLFYTPTEMQDVLGASASAP